MNYLRLAVFTGTSLVLAWIYGEPMAVALAKGGGKPSWMNYLDPINAPMKLAEDVGLDMKKKEPEPLAAAAPEPVAPAPTQNNEAAELADAAEEATALSRRQRADGAAGTVHTGSLGLTGEDEDRKRTRKRTLLGA